MDKCGKLLIILVIILICVTNLVTFEDYKVVLIPVTQELSTVWDSYSQIVDNLGDRV